MTILPRRLRDPFVAALLAAGLSVLPPVPGAGAVSPTSAPGAPPLGNPSRGAALYEARCGACHSLDANRIGPAHRGVFGRRAGTVPGFRYSPALKASGVVWTAPNLDRWLAGPPRMVPGTAMGISVASAQDRADLIAYLNSVSPPVRTPARPSSH